MQNSDSFVKYMQNNAEKSEIQCRRYSFYYKDYIGVKIWNIVMGRILNGPQKRYLLVQLPMVEM